MSIPPVSISLCRLGSAGNSFQGSRSIAASFPPSDWEERDGYCVTTPLRMLRDIAATPVSWPNLEPAVRDPRKLTAPYKTLRRVTESGYVESGYVI